MSALAESHSNPDPLKRKSKSKAAKLIHRYNEIDELVDFVYADYCNGVSKADILQKLMNGLYEGHDKMSYSHSYQYLKSAEKRIAFNKFENEQGLRDVLYTRYESLLEQAIKDGDTLLAKNILDSMSKVFLPSSPTTAVQINSDDNNLTINFGLLKDEG